MNELLYTPLFGVLFTLIIYIAGDAIAKKNQQTIYKQIDGGNIAWGLQFLQ